MEPNKSRELPASVRQFLTVTKPDKLTSKVEPSPLLSRIEAFLPEFEAANKTLVPGQSAVTIGKDEPAKSGDVQMDIYVDDTMGELVPTDKPKKLIEELDPKQPKK